MALHIKWRKNEKYKEVILKGLSELDADELRHYESTKEVLNNLQCIDGGDSHLAQEEAQQPCFSRNEPEHDEITTHHIPVDEEDVLEEILCCSEVNTSGGE